MINIDMHDIPAPLQHLFAQARAGERVLLCEGNVPVIELKPLAQPKAKKERELGNPPFPMTFSDDAFDPLPEDIWTLFEEQDRADKGLKPQFGLAPFPFEVPENIHAPLPDDILDAFEGKESKS